MNSLYLILAWCWLQSLVGAALALVLSRLATRYSPQTGAAIAWSGMLCVLAMTLLTPLPVPLAWTQGNTLSMPAAAPAEMSSLSHAGQPIANSATQSATDGHGFRFVLGRSLVHRVVTSLSHSQSAALQYGGVGRVAIGLVTLGIFVGTWRIVWALKAIGLLRRRSWSVQDDRVTQALIDLQPRMKLGQLPEICESSELVHAAVIGWRRPCVVLPCEWREWSLAELRSVLAHELAHVVRRDAISRCLAMVVLTIHCVQPLMYWLRRQLVLAQELAADELAAAALGSRSEYLRALSTLALRQDGRTLHRPAHLLLPVFSGFLLRRIEMLRAKDGSRRRWVPSVLKGSSWAILATAIVVMTAFRGMAKPPIAQVDKPVQKEQAGASRPAEQVDAVALRCECDAIVKTELALCKMLFVSNLLNSLGIFEPPPKVMTFMGELPSF